MSSPQSPNRVNAVLPADVYNSLKQMAAQQNISLTEALRRSINTEKFFSDKRAKGSKVLLEEDGKLKEIVFKD